METREDYELVSSTYNGIPGVQVLDSGQDGPNIGISVCTHGPEVAGVKALHSFTEGLPLKKHLVRGRIFLILGNPLAYQKFLATGDVPSTRFIDDDMNRCCDDESLTKNEKAYEVGRALQLEEILKDLDVHLDVHQSLKPAPSMVIHGPRSSQALRNVFNVKLALHNITEVQRGKPLIHLTEKHGGIGVGIECDHVGDAGSGLKSAQDNIMRLLESQEVLSTDEKHKRQRGMVIQPEIDDKTEIKVVGSVRAMGRTFALHREFQHGENISRGDEVGSESGLLVHSEYDGMVLFPKAKNNIQPKTEVMFIGEELE